MNVALWTFLLFLNIKNKKNLTLPPRGGGIKYEVIEKLVGDTLLQNIIFKANKNKNKSKRWALYLKYWASYADICEKKSGEISISKKL